MRDGQNPEPESVRRAVAALETELGHLISRDPAAAQRVVEDLVMKTHSASLVATELAIEAGLNFEEIGQALAKVEEAGILIRQAFDMLLGPAANRAQKRPNAQRLVGSVR